MFEKSFPKTWFSTTDKDIGAALAVVAYYIGPELAGELFRVGDNVPIAHTGVTLFEMRNAKGFGEFCNRMRKRPGVSAFFELYSARVFLEAGFQIECWPEREHRVKGEDFDFSARLGEIIVNVEVTSLDREVYALKPVVNTLKKKKNQLPSGAPAVIFCKFPASWFDRADFQPNIDLFFAACRFFGGTERINAVVFLCDVVRDTPDGGAFFSSAYWVFTHPLPRHSFDTTFFYREVAWADEARLVVNKGDGWSSLHEKSRDSDFHRWVDIITSPPDCH